MPAYLGEPEGLAAGRRAVEYATVMLAVPEIAARLGRDPETIRRWIRTDKLRARRIGTQYVVEERDLAALLDGDRLPLPRAWKTTSTREPMPNVVEALRRTRTSH